MLAYDPQRMTLIDQQNINFNHLSDDIEQKYVREKFIRNNVGLLALFDDNNCQNNDDKTVKKKIILSNLHVFWNPAHPDIKLAQVKFWRKQLLLFMSKHSCHCENTVVIVGGDFNSLPDSNVYTEMTSIHEVCTDINSFVQSSLQITADKFLCDNNLNKLCRWMRVLGIDTKLESNQSAKARSGGNMTSVNCSELFDTAFRENRILLTSSRRMLALSKCPRSFYVSTSTSLEQVLLEICRTHQVILNPEKFLTVCGKCNGEIEECEMNDKRITEIVVPKDKQIYICVDCAQPYWWYVSRFFLSFFYIHLFISHFN